MKFKKNSIHNSIKKNKGIFVETDKLIIRKCKESRTVKIILERKTKLDELYH